MFSVVKDSNSFLDILEIIMNLNTEFLDRKHLVSHLFKKVFFSPDLPLFATHFSSNDVHIVLKQ